MYTTFDALQNRFLRYADVLPCASRPIYERWHQIVIGIPACRGLVRLTGDLSTIYAEAERDWTGTKLYLALDLALLQASFWRWLRERKLTFHHVAEYHIHGIEAWQTRLYQRWEDTTDWRRKKGAIEPPKKPPATYAARFN